MRKIYQLCAKGDYALFSGRGTVLSKNVYLTKELAESAIPEFHRKVTDDSEGAESLAMLEDSPELKITVHELILEGL